jgi:hypothetical protein
LAASIMIRRTMRLLTTLVTCVHVGVAAVPLIVQNTVPLL